MGKLDLKTRADSKQETEFRRLLGKSAGDYVPIQLERRTPLNEEDPLERDAVCLAIGEVDPEEKIELMLAMRDQANDAIRANRTDPHYKMQVLANAGAQVDEILKKHKHVLKKYKHVFSLKLTGRPPCKIELNSIPL